MRISIIFVCLPAYVIVYYFVLVCLRVCVRARKRLLMHSSVYVRVFIGADAFTPTQVHCNLCDCDHAELSHHGAQLLQSLLSARLTSSFP